MSHRAERTSGDESPTATTDRPEPLGVESGLEALRTSPEFRGPVEPLDGAETNEHIALFYETPEERYAAVVPFVRQGVERGERVMYVVDGDEEDEVREALRAADFEYDEAIESGQLTFHTLDETYLRTGRFDPDDMIEFYGRAIEEATVEYPALRVSADTKWILDERTEIADFMAYESRVNDLFRGEDCIALCQYDCERIPPEVLSDVVRTHPHLIYDGTLCHNFYYTPPREFFEPDEPARDVERMLGTLVDRTRAKVELDETIEELEESNERLQRFAYVASHDLQEPLRMISSYLQLLERRYRDDLNADAREYIDFAVDGADRMREMVDGLLTYSRIDMQEEAFEPVDVGSVLENVLADHCVQIVERGAEIVVDERLTICESIGDDVTEIVDECGEFGEFVSDGEDRDGEQPAEAPVVLGDPSQLDQVFGNLVSNAIKYGGDEPRIEIGARRRADRWVFSVADDGIGLDPGYADEIFEVFNRLHSAEEYEGTGIGLALCRKIVEHHGGEIWVDSAPGEGSTFYFTVPAAE